MGDSPPGTAGIAVLCPDCGQPLIVYRAETVAGYEWRWACERCALDFDPIAYIVYPTERSPDAPATDARPLDG